jgi:hypothetical protein
VSEGFVLIPMITACQQLGLEPEQILMQRWAEALARQFADGRRELAVRLPTWLLDERTRSGSEGVYQPKEKYGERNADDQENDEHFEAVGRPIVGLTERRVRVASSADGNARHDSTVGECGSKEMAPLFLLKLIASRGTIL